VDLRTELEALFGFYEALADEQGVTLVLEGSGTVGGDALMIRRALGNLLANAIRHAPRDATVQARLGTRSDGGVTLVLQNPGSITAEHLLHLFDRFYRVDASRQAASEGAGLGLAITQSIVAAHGAAIRAESDCGEVRFTVDWPPPGAPAATPTSERSPGTTNDARLANRRSPT
jgi:two-component system heavy metal sensor histidine kinase CusS